MKKNYSLYKFIAGREKVMRGVFAVAAFFSVLALLTITVFLFANGLPFMFTHGSFWGTTWHIDAEQYGILSMIVASLYLTALSTVIGVVIGLFTAICLYKFCPKKLVAPISQMVNLLAGIPSVIYGLFGLIIVVPFLQKATDYNTSGTGILPAAIILAIMILPTVVSMSLDALRAVPQSYYEGALALGATKEQTTFKVLLPAAKSGIFAGVVLAIGRAIGEAMAVTLVIGNSAEMPIGLLQSVRTLTTNIAMSATEISGDAQYAFVACGVILFVFALIINVAFTLLKRDKDGDKKRKKSAEKAADKKDEKAFSSAPVATNLEAKENEKE